MMAAAWTLFDTDIGRCGIAWTGAGVSGFQLPEASEAETQARLRRRCGDGPAAHAPAAVAAAIEGVRGLLGGGRTDLSFIDLDQAQVPAFHRKVFAVLRAIQAGQTLTYGQVAARAGSPGGAQAVGQALARNPWPVIVPCHRVLAAGGKPGGFTAPGGMVTKARLLALEGVALRPQGALFED